MDITLSTEAISPVIVTWKKKQHNKHKYTHKRCIDIYDNHTMNASRQESSFMGNKLRNAL